MIFNKICQIFKRLIYSFIWIWSTPTGKGGSSLTTDNFNMYNFYGKGIMHRQRCTITLYLLKKYNAAVYLKVMSDNILLRKNSMTALDILQ